MSLVQSLLRYLWPADGETSPEVPDDVCPNCWGRFEYDGQIKGEARNRKLDVAHHREREAFVQEFVTANLDGIRLDNRDRACPRCGKASKPPI